VFYSAFFTSDPASAGTQTFFPAGTKQVFAVWSYQNMRQGMAVRREWYFNGQLWLTRREIWDLTKYGESGVVRDVSIHDFGVGLSSGTYQLRIYIDNVIQPIGLSATGQPETQVTFEIRQVDETQTQIASPDDQWAVTIFGEKRIVLQSRNGSPMEIFMAREVPYVIWFDDSHHFLFVDRDRSGQQPGTTIGIKDELWIVDVPSGDRRLIYISETSFQGHAAPLPSPNGRYIVGLEGSGYADACMIDSHLIFFELNSDYIINNVVKQAEFSGLPSANDGTIYPVEDGTWQDGIYLVNLDGTCNADRSKLGPYTFNMADLSAVRASSSTPPIAGDLGTGRIHGRLTDAVTGAPVAGAIVTCQHHSYSSSPQGICSGTATTDADGVYVFENVFFHDTDSITLTIQANGCLTQELSQTFFTANDMEADWALNR
jgi:hypothetical protein